jgi:hypothetical protein
MSICTETKRSEQKLDACDAYFGERHCRIIECADDQEVGGINNYKFDLNGVDENYEEKKYVIFLTSDSEPVEPVIAADQTLVTVEFDAFDDMAEEGVTASDIAALIKTAVDALNIFKTERNGGVLHIRNKFLGVIAVETNTAALFDFEVGKLGFGGSLGAFAPGGASLTTETIVEQVFADQTGEILLDEIIKGQNVSLEVTLAEMTQDRWESLVGNVSGSNLTVNAKKLTGYGTGKLFQSKFQFAGMLVLHPIALPKSNRSSDYVIHKTAPDMSSINFSGSELQGAEFVFNAYQDKSVDSKVDLFVKGDYTEL